MQIAALIVRSTYIKQTLNIRSDNYQALNLCPLKTRLLLAICKTKEIVVGNYKESYMRFNSCNHVWVQRVDFANLAQCE